MPTRRSLLRGGAATLAAVAGASRAAGLSLRAVQQGDALGQLAAGGPTGLLGIGLGGALWALSADAAPQRLALGLDPATAPVAGHGRIAARRADASLLVWQGGREQRSGEGTLAPHAGLLNLPLAVIATLSAGPSYRLARLEPDAAQRWAPVALSAEPVLPDGWPVQVDLDAAGDGGQIAVLAGPDAQRYAHGVLGDAIEATRVLYLERHSLQVQRELTIAAPHVLEDLLLRPVALGAGRMGLLSVRSGPQGAQLVLLAADAGRARALHIAALGEAIGQANRWLAPTSDGQRWLAVHTPHIGGVLHEYRRDGSNLPAVRIAGGVSNHRIGTRRLDLGAWRGRWLALPDQARRSLRLFDSQAGWREAAPVALPAALSACVALADPLALALLLEDGQAVQLRLAA